MARVKRFVLKNIFVILGIIIAACSFPGPSADPTEPASGVVMGQARVDTIEVLILESFPVQVNAVLSGEFPNGCTTLSDIQVARDGNTFTVVLLTEAPGDVACTEALVPFSESVSLEVNGLPTGDYTVVSGDAAATFNLAVDNVLTDDGGPLNPSSISGVVWHDLCAIAGGEGGEPALPSEGCIDQGDDSYEADGVLENDEPGIEGVEVVLLENDCQGSPVTTLFTSPDGLFSFFDIPAGSYCVSIDSLANPNSGILIPGSWTFPPDGIGQQIVTVGEGEAVENVNFGWDYQFLPDPTGGPTPTPEPTPTQGANNPGCTNKAEFIDETVEDNTVISAGQLFTKTWIIKNTGTCRWTEDYSVVFQSGEQMAAGEALDLTERVSSQEELLVSIPMTAPQSPGTYRADYKFQDDFGNTFGLGTKADLSFWVQIKVEGQIVNLNLGDPDWSDDFDDGSNWFLFKLEDIVRFSIEDGRMRLRAITAGQGDFWGLSNQPALRDFYIEATFITGDNCVGLDRYGFILRAPETDKGYIFNFTCNGQYRVYIWDGNYKEVQGWVTNKALKTGPNATNRIGVWFEGDDLRIIINDVEIANYTLEQYDEGQFGLLVGSTNTNNLDIFVDEMSYWILK